VTFKENVFHQTSLHAKEKKASGFVYHNGTCTIGRVHPFGNPFSPQKLAMTKYTDGVHVYEGKGCFANGIEVETLQE